MFKDKKNLFNLSLLGIFVWLLVTSYSSSKRKPESVGELLNDFSWLSNWPKWLDLPLMPWINKWFRALNALLIHGIKGKSNHFGQSLSQEKSFNNSPIFSGFLFDEP